MSAEHTGLNSFAGCETYVWNADASARISLAPEAMAKLPPLEDLGVRPEILEAAEVIVSVSDVSGVDRSALQDLVKLVVYYDRLYGTKGYSL